MNTKEEQFTAIIQKHERTIYTVCYMFSNNTDEVDDLYQEILIRLWKGFDAFEGNGWTWASVRTRTTKWKRTCR